MFRAQIYFKIFFTRYGCWYIRFNCAYQTPSCPMVMVVFSLPWECAPIVISNECYSRQEEVVLKGLGTYMYTGVYELYQL